MGTRAVVCTRASLWHSRALWRTFSISTRLESGHNRWSKIKHDKAKADAGKSKERTILALNVIRASKVGGPDLKMNPSLATAVAMAKKSQLSKEAIEKAIAKGQGKSVNGSTLESVTIETMLPHGVAAIVECQTDNKTRILQDVRLIISRAGGSVSPTAFLFEKKGKIWFLPHKSVGLDEALDEAIEGGANDIELEDGRLVVETPPDLITAVSTRLKQSLGLEVDRTELIYDPREETLVKLDDTQAGEIQTVLDALEEQDDVQEFYVNASF